MAKNRWSGTWVLATLSLLGISRKLGVAVAVSFRNAHDADTRRRQSGFGHPFFGLAPVSLLARYLGKWIPKTIFVAPRS